MTHKQAQRLINKLAKMRHELEHDARRIGEYTYAAGAIHSAAASLQHAASMIEMYHLGQK